mgnify:CR=1 FL=1
MKRHWEIDELIEHFMLRPEELGRLSGSSPANQLGMATLMKFFEYEALPQQARIFRRFFQLGQLDAPRSDFRLANRQRNWYYI